MKPLPCIVCARHLNPVAHDMSQQPYNGTMFSTHGNYGSTIFDPMDGHFLELNICDTCLADRAEEGGFINIAQSHQQVIEDGVVVGWKPTNYKPVPWEPTQKELDFARERRKEER